MPSGERALSHSTLVSMTDRRVPWPEIPWEAGNHPLELKKIAPGLPCVMVRFLPGFFDPNLCERSHVIYVLEGVLTLELGDDGARVERCAAGESYILPRGTVHRARNDGEHDVTALLVSDASWT